MKSFLEEYGFAILACIVIILLIVICTPFGSTIRQQISNVVDKFDTAVKKKQNSNSQKDVIINEENGKIKMFVLGASDTDEFEYVLHYTSGGVKTEDPVLNLGPSEREVLISPTKIPDVNSQAHVELKDIGTGEKYISNTMKVVNLNVEPALTVLKSGPEFNVLLKQLAGHEVTASELIEWEGDYYDFDITSIQFDSSYEKPDSGYVELQSSGEPVYAWKDGPTIKITSTANVIYANEDSSYMFADFFCDEDQPHTIDTDWFNTSNVTDMSYMFYDTWFYASSFSLDLSDWDTSNVTNMSSMFTDAGCCASTWSIGGLSNWNTSKVTNMSYMFSDAGSEATTFNLDVSNWNVSNVTDMSHMFYNAGYSATTWSVGDISNWNVSNVADMSSMFYNAGYDATTFNLDVSNWNVSNVNDMSYMFNGAGYSAPTWSVGDISNWNVSNVADMSSMFYNAGYDATTFNLDVSNWNVSNVNDMTNMFEKAGHSATTWSVGDISNWNVSNVTKMYSMFEDAGYSATTFNLDVSNWVVSNVTDMRRMFYSAGYSATTWSVGDISNWNVSNVTKMTRMFTNAGCCASSFSLDLSGWDVSNNVDMDFMFVGAGKNATTWKVIIPAKTGTQNNSTSTWYGKTTSASPASGKAFTLAS